MWSLAVQLVSNETHVGTGEPWRHWFDYTSWSRILKLAQAYGFEEVSMEPDEYVDPGTAACLPGALEGAFPTNPTKTP